MGPAQTPTSGTPLERVPNEHSDELSARVHHFNWAWPVESATTAIVEPDAREPLKKLTDLPVTVRARGITWTRDGSGFNI